MGSGASAQDEGTNRYVGIEDYPQYLQNREEYVQQDSFNPDTFDSYDDTEMPEETYRRNTTMSLGYQIQRRAQHPDQSSQPGLIVNNPRENRAQVDIVQKADFDAWKRHKISKIFKKRFVATSHYAQFFSQRSQYPEAAAPDPDREPPLRLKRSVPKPLMSSDLWEEDELRSCEVEEEHPPHFTNSVPHHPNIIRPQSNQLNRVGLERNERNAILPTRNSFPDPHSIVMSEDDPSIGGPQQYQPDTVRPQQHHHQQQQQQQQQGNVDIQQSSATSVVGRSRNRYRKQEGTKRDSTGNESAVVSQTLSLENTPRRSQPKKLTGMKPGRRKGPATSFNTYSSPMTENQKTKRVCTIRNPITGAREQVEVKQDPKKGDSGSEKYKSDAGHAQDKKDKENVPDLLSEDKKPTTITNNADEEHAQDVKIEDQHEDEGQDVAHLEPPKELHSAEEEHDNEERELIMSAKPEVTVYPDQTKQQGNIIAQFEGLDLDSLSMSRESSVVIRRPLRYQRHLEIQNDYDDREQIQMPDRPRDIVLPDPEQTGDRERACLRREPISEVADVWPESETHKEPGKNGTQDAGQRNVAPLKNQDNTKQTNRPDMSGGSPRLHYVTQPPTKYNQELHNDSNLQQSLGRIPRRSQDQIDRSNSNPEYTSTSGSDPVHDVSKPHVSQPPKARRTLQDNAHANYSTPGNKTMRYHQRIGKSEERLNRPEAVIKQERKGRSEKTAGINQKKEVVNHQVGDPEGQNDITPVESPATPKRFTIYNAKSSPSHKPPPRKVFTFYKKIHEHQPKGKSVTQTNYKSPVTLNKPRKVKQAVPTTADEVLPPGGKRFQRVLPAGS